MGIKQCNEMMSVPVRIARETDTAASCARRMNDEDIGLLPVVDGSGKLSGIVTDRDLAMRVLAETRKPSVQVKEIMTGNALVTCGLNESLASAGEKMSRARKSRIVVVDDANKPLGVISLSDIARAESRQRAGEILSSVACREAKPHVLVT